MYLLYSYLILSVCKHIFYVGTCRDMNVFFFFPGCFSLVIRRHLDRHSAVVFQLMARWDTRFRIARHRKVLEQLMFPTFDAPMKKIASLSLGH
jgi:hypothetical protein